MQNPYLSVMLLAEDAVNPSMEAFRQRQMCIRDSRKTITQYLNQLGKKSSKRFN